jgi:hypothetical protein
MTAEIDALPGDSTASTAFGLQWAVKHSFLAYVARAAGGRAYVDRGALVTSENEVVFPFEQEPQPADRTGSTLRFGGQVLFVAHGGLLYVRIADPTIRLSDGSGVLTAGATNESGDAVRVGLATFTITKFPVRRRRDGMACRRRPPDGGGHRDLQRRLRGRRTNGTSRPAAARNLGPLPDRCAMPGSTSTRPKAIGQDRRSAIFAHGVYLRCAFTRIHFRWPMTFMT